MEKVLKLAAQGCRIETVQFEAHASSEPEDLASKPMHIVPGLSDSGSEYSFGMDDAGLGERDWPL